MPRRLPTNSHRPHVSRSAPFCKVWRRVLTTLTGVMLLCHQPLTWGQQFSGTFTFGSSGNVTAFPYNGTPIPNVTVSDLSKVGVTTSSSNNNFRATNWPLNTTPGLDLSKYFEFTLTADTGYTIDMTDLTFGVGRSGTGPVNWEWRNDLDSYASTLSNFTTLATGLTQSGGVLTNPDSNSNWTGNVLDVSSSAGLNAITFRFYGYNAEGTAGSGGLAGPLSFSGTVNAPTGTNYTWTGSGSGGTWGNGVQGQFNAAYTNSSTAVAEFSGTGELVTVDNAGVEAGQLRFNSTGFTVSGGPITLGVGTITTDTSTETTVTSVIAGTSGILKAGDGTLTLGGTNTFTGGVTLSGGRIAISADGNLGDATNGLALAGGTLAPAATMSLSAGRAVSGAGAIDIATGTTLTVNGDYNASTTLSGAGTLDLQGAVRDMGTLTFNAAGSLTAAGTVTGGGVTVASLGGGTALITPALDLGTGSKTINVASAATLDLRGGLTFAGTLTKEGAGTLILPAGSVVDRLSVGRAGSSFTDGGVTRVSDTAALGGNGTNVVYYNYGSVELTAPITMPNGISFGGRLGTEAVIGGAGGNQALTVDGPVGFYGPNATFGTEMAVDVNNTTTINGVITLATNANISGWTLGGSGRLNVTADNTTTLTAPITLTDTVTLNLTGATGGSLSLGAGTALLGTGKISGGISGAGTVAAGASPGILTAGTLEGSGGLNFQLEFTGASPDYTNASASVNDVIRLTDASPFTTGLTNGNLIEVFFDVATLAAGARFEGGFFTDTATDFTADINGANFSYYVFGDGNGTDVNFGGKNYYSLTSFDATLFMTVSTVAASADFGAGVMNGQVSSFTAQAVPEPSSLALAFGGLLTAGALALRRRLQNRRSQG